MESALKERVFLYNKRILFGLSPCFCLVVCVAGKLLVALVFAMLAFLVLRTFHQKLLAAVLSVVSVLALEVLNVYIMAPLLWQSFFNISLFILFHICIAASGLWWWMQDEHFFHQVDTRFGFVAEKILFCAVPGISMVSSSWLSWMLFGSSVLPYVTCFHGAICILLFMAPLPSSYTSAHTPSSDGTIQPTVAVYFYLIAGMCLPTSLFILITPFSSVNTLANTGLLVSSPIFLLSILLQPKQLELYPLRVFGNGLLGRSAGTAMMLSAITLLLHSEQLSAYMIPAVLSFLCALTMMLGVFKTPAVWMALCLFLAYLCTPILLPWSVSYVFTGIFSVSVFHGAVLSLNVVSILLLLHWDRAASYLWLPYNLLFACAECVLKCDAVYPSYLLLATALLGGVLSWRFFLAGHLSTSSCAVGISVHMTKISLLLLPVCSLSSHASSAAAVFSISFAVLSLLLSEAHCSPLRLLLLSGVLLLGLLLSLDALLSPIWSLASHSLPSTATLLACVLVSLGLFLMHGASWLRHTPPLLAKAPPFLYLVALLLFLLQPSFNTEEVTQALKLLSSSWELAISDEHTYLSAWNVVLVWTTVLSCVGAMVLLTGFVQWTLLQQLNSVALGASLGYLAALWLSHLPPTTLISTLYATTSCLHALLLARALSGSGTLKDTMLFGCYLVVFVVLSFLEVERFAALSTEGTTQDTSPVPSTQLLMLGTVSVATVFRVKMYLSGDSPYLPGVANLSCVLFFALSFVNVLHVQVEVSVVLSSCVFLLLQPDGSFIPESKGVFPAPSVLASVFGLYCLSASRLASTLLSLPTFYSTNALRYVLEGTCLLTALPGHCIFLFYLWTGKKLKLAFWLFFCYIFPSALLPQVALASGAAGSVLGLIGVVTFCLLLVGDYANLKIP